MIVRAVFAGAAMMWVTGCSALRPGSGGDDFLAESYNASGSERSPVFRPWVAPTGDESAGANRGGGVDGGGLPDQVPLVEDMSIHEIRTGDPVIVNLRGIYPRDESIEALVDEFGNITLPLLGDVHVDGLTPSQVSAKIRRLYIDGGYYRSLTVNVVMPSRSYFIRGEVRGPGRYPIVRGMTLLQAVTAAGGYTEFANSRSVRVIRSGVPTTYNLRDIERNPERDVRIESGDIIIIDRSRF